MIDHFHVFTNDLRLVDNRVLHDCIKPNSRVLGLFIIDKRQTSSTHSSTRAVSFMLDCLGDLGATIAKKGGRLIICDREQFKVLLQKYKPSTLSIAEYLSAFAIKRLNWLHNLCKPIGCSVLTANDYCLSDTIVKDDGSPYMIFSAYLKKFKDVNTLYTTPKITWVSIQHSIVSWVSELRVSVDIQGGRTSGLIALKNAIESPLSSSTIVPTSRLSAYLNFGCLSSREVYRKWGSNRQQLVWRDFYYSQLLVPDYRRLEWGGIYDNIRWTNSKKLFNLFWESKTGFHVVDAAMAELRATGFMHNRARMLWAFFAIKMLHIDPLHPSMGAYHLFSRLLIDCNTPQNKGNFLWILSTFDMGGRRYSQGADPLCGRYMDVSNANIRKLQADDYVNKWLPLENRISPIFDHKERWRMYDKLVKDAKN